MNILALDTSTDACSVALWTINEVFSLHENAPRKHGEKVLGMIDQVLEQAGLTYKDLNGVAYGRGPGSFTGVRLGVSVAQSIAYANNIPAVGVSTLENLAFQALFKEPVNQVAVAMDARMKEVYTAQYKIEGEDLVCVSDEQVCAPEAVNFKLDAEWVAAGDGFVEYEDRCQALLSNHPKAVIGDLEPRADVVAHIALGAFEADETESAMEMQPVYLRNNVAEKSKKVANQIKQDLTP